VNGWFETLQFTEDRRLDGRNRMERRADAAKPEAAD